VELPPPEGINVAAMQSLAARTDADAMGEIVTADIAERVWPVHTRDPDFREALRLSVRDNVRAIVALFGGQLNIAETDPHGAFGFADLTAELGIPVSELENGYWVGVQSFWRLWFAEARREAGAEGSLAELLGPATHLLFEYIIHILGAVVSRYDATRAEILRNQEDRRRAVLADILEGRLTAGGQDVENTLGYRLRGVHVALAMEVDQRARAERVRAELFTRTGAVGSLLTLHAPGIWLAWLGFPAAPGGTMRAAVAEAAGAAEIPLAVGAPGEGLAGLRRTGLQALDTARLRRRFEGFGDVLWFSDVRLELLMLSDEPTARQFVADELGELAGADERAVRTRETLLAWLTTGSQAGAATRLGVHENTVRLRIRHAEEVLADGLADRRAEILAALRLAQLFGPLRPPISMS
jgi:PucR C-terminal helix-turn-helix domain/GGDEF-like domain